MAVGVVAESWAVGAGVAVRRGRPPSYFDPNFPLGVEEPTRANTGPRVSEAQMTNYSGSITNVTEGEVLDRLIITGQFRPNRTCTLRDSRILGGPAPNPGGTNSWPLVDTRNLNIIDPVRIEHCHLDPSHRSVDVYGFMYAGHDAYRCLIEGVVDGASPMGGGSRPNTVNRVARYHACMFTDSPFYEHDPRQTDGSHNDFIQAHGSLESLEVIGCSFGFDGSVAMQSIILGQGHGDYTGPVIITDNWFYGAHDTYGAVFNVTGSGYNAPYDMVRFWRNRVHPDVNHSGASPIIVRQGLTRFPEAFGMIGEIGSHPNTWTPGPNHNYYMGTGEPARLGNG